MITVTKIILIIIHNLYEWGKWVWIMNLTARDKIIIKPFPLPPVFNNETDISLPKPSPLYTFKIHDWIVCLSRKYLNLKFPFSIDTMTPLFHFPFSFSFSYVFFSFCLGFPLHTEHTENGKGERNNQIKKNKNESRVKGKKTEWGNTGEKRERMKEIRGRERGNEKHKWL